MRAAIQIADAVPPKDSSRLQQFAALILAVAELYEKTPSKEAIRLYFGALEDLSLEEVKAGISRHVNDPDRGRFMPKPADIRHKVQGSIEDRALEAWTKVDGAICSVGAYSSVTFDDPIINRVVRDMGGWVKMCDITDREAPFVQKEFERRYGALAERGQLDYYPPSLSGIIERQNGYSGPPQLVGDQAKAQKVLESGKSDKTGQVLAKLRAGLKEEE